MSTPLWTAFFVLAFDLAVLNAVVSSLLGINDADDSFYRNVIRWLERRRLRPTADLDAPGTILVQLDGLAEPILRAELRAGRLPTLGR